MFRQFAPRRWTSSANSVSKQVQMSYARHGNEVEGTPLVICHGLFGQKQNWNSVSKALAQRLKSPVYAIDFRNHGESPWTQEHSYEAMASDLSLFLETVVEKETGANKSNLLGHSMGGKVVAYFAQQPDMNQKLDHLIIEDIAPHRHSSASLFSKYVEALRKVDLTKTRAEILVQLEQVVPELAVRQFLLTNLLREDGVFKWKMNLEAIGSALNHVLEFKIKGTPFDGPTLLVYGGNSEYFLDSDREPLKQHFPRVQFECIPGAGHWLHAEFPQLFMDHVVRFLEQ